jgi:type IV pilus assembly protein PilN
MRISINLATKPFVELRPLFAKLRLAMAVLAFLAIGLTLWLHVLTAQAKQATAQMDRLKAATADFQNERARNEARMKQPQNKAVLDRSIFLNQLFANKSFSWTATMMDLERVLPTGIQVTSIEPQITKEGDVMIRLRVSGDRDRAIQLVRNLETSQRFVGSRLAGESAMPPDKAKALGGLQNVSAMAGGTSMGTPVEFEIFSGYNPLQPAVPVLKGKVSSKQMGEQSLPAGPVVLHDRHPKKPSADVVAAPGYLKPANGGKQ